MTQIYYSREVGDSLIEEMIKGIPFVEIASNRWVDTTHTKEDWSLQKTAEILSIPEVLESIEKSKQETREGKVIPLDNFSEKKW